LRGRRHAGQRASRTSAACGRTSRGRGASGSLEASSLPHRPQFEELHRPKARHELLQIFAIVIEAGEDRSGSRNRRWHRKGECRLPTLHFSVEPGERLEILNDVHPQEIDHELDFPDRRRDSRETAATATHMLRHARREGGAVVRAPALPYQRREGLIGAWNIGRVWYWWCDERLFAIEPIPGRPVF